jgi:hypothetical protein
LRHRARYAEDVADDQERWMIETFDEPQPFIERKLEGRHGRQLRPQHQRLLIWPSLRIAHKQAIAKPVAKKQLI